MSNVRSSEAREARLYLVAALAAVYLLAWTQTAPEPAASGRGPTTGAAVWLDELPIAERPTVSPPSGWRVAERGEQAAPTPRRVSSPRPPRVRTRSS